MVLEQEIAMCVRKLESKDKNGSGMESEEMDVIDSERPTSQLSAFSLIVGFKIDFSLSEVIDEIDALANNLLLLVDELVVISVFKPKDEDNEMSSGLAEELLSVNGTDCLCRRQANLQSTSRS